MQSKAYLGKYLNTADGISKIFRQEGLMAFTRGFEPSLWRQGVWNGMSVVFSACRCRLFLTLLHQLLRHLPLFFSNVAVCWHQQGQQHHIKILVMHALHIFLNASLTFHSGRCGVFGGVLATVFNNPFDVVVSRARNIIDYNGAPYKYVFARYATPRCK